MPGSTLGKLPDQPRQRMCFMAVAVAATGHMPPALAGSCCSLWVILINSDVVARNAFNDTPFAGTYRNGAIL